MSGRRRRSIDLPQGGLEEPCTLTFIRSDKEVSKVDRLIKAAPTEAVDDRATMEEPISIAEEPSSKKKCIDRVLDGEEDSIWLTINGEFLTRSDTTTLIKGGCLNDRHINFAQQLLHKQYPTTGNTLLEAKTPLNGKIKCGLQILHDRGNHWVVASNIGCDHVTIYDLLYDTIDEKTKGIVNNLFDLPDPTMINIVMIQKQGGKDCGLFAIGTATSILFNANMVPFSQSKMRQHLFTRFSGSLLPPFQLIF